MSGSQPVKPGDRVLLERRKWPDQPHYRFVGTVLGEDEFGLWSVVPPQPVFVGDDFAFNGAATSAHLVPREGGWWAAFWLTDGGLNTYVDIGTEPVWHGGHATMIDLDLDVIQWAGSDAVIADEDEFEANSVAFGYPADVMTSARKTADELLQRVRNGEPPFGDAGPQWLAEALAMERLSIIRFDQVLHSSAVLPLLTLASFDEERARTALQRYEDEWSLDVLIHEDAVVGVAGYERTASTCEVHHIAVTPNHRRAGLGSALLKSVIRRTSTVVTAETHADAVGFYERAGFLMTSLGERYPGTPRFACLYPSSLQPMPIEVLPLSTDELVSIPWAGSRTHLRNIEAQLVRAERGEVSYLAARIGGVPYAVGAIDFVVEPDAATVFQMATRPEMEGCGLATALMREFEAVAKRRSVQRMRLGVEVDNTRALRLYEHLGYQTLHTAESSWDAEDEAGDVVTYTAMCVEMTKPL